MTATFGSLFAGVGGFDLGFEQAGFDCRFQVEWDKHCQQTLAYHWPNTPRWGDVSEVNGADLPPVDVITYGFPCQDLSVAGQRAGLEGGRSGLFFEAIRIITEMREATNGQHPTWAVAENVTGLLNADNGHAMRRCVDELAEAGSLVIEWCLVDAQWFGVPQRRRRVFIASCFNPATARTCPDPLFPIAGISSRNPQPCQQSRKHTATTTPQSTSANSHTLTPFVKSARVRTDETPETWIENRPNPTLNSFDQGDIRTTTLVVSKSQSAHLTLRRLTPIETERLMGWPDDHTLHRADSKTNSDSTRYKMCGNGIVAPVSRWIAKHLANTLTDD